MATVTGTAGDDFIHVSGDGLTPPPGTNEVATATNCNDVITSGAGTDIIYAGGGNDQIQIHASSDISGLAEYVDGGVGYDQVWITFGGTTDLTRVQFIGVEAVLRITGTQPLSIRVTADQLNSMRFGVGPNDRIYLHEAGSVVYRQSRFDGILVGTSGDDVLDFQTSGKFSINGGAGIGHVSDQDIADPSYTGLRQIYNRSIGYTPTEKTYFRINLGMQGADIRPNFSLAAGWNAREKTRLSLSLYQNQGFSSLSPDQYNVTRGFMGTITQRLIKGIDLSLSGGYEQSLNVGLSKSKNDSLEGPSSHYLTNATMNWRLREWAAWQNTLMMTSGRGSNNQTQTSFSTGLNFNF